MRKNKVQQWTGYDCEGKEYHNGFGSTKAAGIKSLKLANPSVVFVQVEKYTPYNDDENFSGLCEAEAAFYELNRH